MQSSTQEDSYSQTSNIPQYSNRQYFEKSVAIDLLLPAPSPNEAQRQDLFNTEDNSKPDQKSHAHLDEDEMADLLDHADHASGEVQQMILSSDYGGSLMMHYHDSMLLSQLDVSTLKPLIEHLANAGIL